MKLLVVIPAYNEAVMIVRVVKSVKKALKKISGFSKKEVVVINDGSSDKTATLAARYSDLVLNHLTNQGLGAALSTGFIYGKRHQFDILVTFDADGQHRATDIWKLIQPIQKNQADVVIGSRLLGLGKMPLSRILINYVANILTFFTGGVWSTDSQSGLRAINKKALNLLKLRTRGMEVSSEILTQVKMHNLRYSEIAIPAIYTDYSQTKGQQLRNAPGVFFRLIFRIIR